MIAGLTDQQVDALFWLNVEYWHAEHHDQAKEHELVVSLYPHLSGMHRGVEVRELYAMVIEEYAADRLPEEYFAAYDHWGAKCFTNDKGFTSPPEMHTVLTGDISGHYMAFASAQALRERMDEIINNLNDNQLA